MDRCCYARLHSGMSVGFRSEGPTAQPARPPPLRRARADAPGHTHLPLSLSDALSCSLSFCCSPSFNPSSILPPLSPSSCWSADVSSCVALPDRRRWARDYKQSRLQTGESFCFHTQNQMQKKTFSCFSFTISLLSFPSGLQRCSGYMISRGTLKNQPQAQSMRMCMSQSDNA